MTTPYFLLQKPIDSPIYDSSQSSILVSPPSLTYILPQNNLAYYAENGLFEKELIDWCKQFGDPEKVFLDIGAHTGTYSISLAKYFKNVHAFEPQKMTYYALCGSIALSRLRNVDCHNFGLGDESQVGTQTLHIVSNDGGGSSIHKNEQEILATESIEIRTLDSLRLRSIGLIKMDVEENEFFVLKGGLETLRRSGYPRILFESNLKISPVFDFLKNIGYSITALTGSENMFLAFWPS
jgi:FkbM family methyltransferase